MNTINTSLKETDTYGRTIENPLRIHGIRDSIIFLQNLVADNYKYILFHRSSVVGSLEQPIDHYEVCAGDGQRFDLYIDKNNDKTFWIPPFNFKFERSWFNYYDSYCEIKIVTIDPLHLIQKELDKSIYNDKKDGYLLDTSDSSSYQIIMTESFGVDHFVENFPTSLFEEYFFKHSFLRNTFTDSQLKQKDEYYKGQSGKSISTI